MTNNQLLVLLKDMSLKEKIGQLLQLDGSFFANGMPVTGPMEAAGFDSEDLALCGSVLNLHGAAAVRTLQAQAMQRQPHKIPLLVMLDVINGYQTIFPIPLAQGCSFSREGVREAAAIAAKEASFAGQHVTFSPMVDLVRDPRWGRVMESTGEDSYLNGELAAAAVHGYQGSDLKASGSIAACVKHFAGYGMPCGGREYNNVELSERTLREAFLPGYAAAIDAGAALVMTAFHSMNRVPATGDEQLLRDILRGEMGFDGVLISDYAAIRELIPHGVAADEREAAKLAIRAGVDIDMGTPVYMQQLERLVQDGEISEALVDEAVLRVLELKNRLGLFEDPYRDASEEKAKIYSLCAQHRAAARRLAAKTFVLLKNAENLLPLPPQGKKLAFIGPYAQSRWLFGAWSLLGREEDTVNLREGVEAKGIEAAFAAGCGILPANESLSGFGGIIPPDMDAEQEKAALLHAVETAKAADIVILCLGEHPHQTGEGGSYADLRLPVQQRRLFDAVHAVNKNVVLLVFSGRPMELREECARAKSVLLAWFPGTEGGNALADVLFGECVPEGKLSMSIPVSVGQIPVFYSEFCTGRPDQRDLPYRRFLSHYQDIPNEPLYPFGYGLSYTSFEYSPVTLDCDVIVPGGALTASVTVTNAGPCKGTETVQMYLRDLVGSVVRPVRELKGFEKVTLETGESTTIAFTITEESLKVYDIHMNHVVEPGEFEVFIGGDSTTSNGARFLR